MLHNIESYKSPVIEEILHAEDNLSILFIEVIKGLAAGNDFFPIFYLLSMIDLNNYNEEEQIKLGSLFIYLRLVWIQNPELKYNVDALNHIAEFFLKELDLAKAEEIIALYTTSLNYNSLIISTEERTNWATMVTDSESL